MEAHENGRRLLLDKRWSFRERWRYSMAIEYGEFAIAADILLGGLTPEERERTIRKGKEMARQMGIPTTDG